MRDELIFVCGPRRRCVRWDTGVLQAAGVHDWTIIR